MPEIICVSVELKKRQNSSVSIGIFMAWVCVIKYKKIFHLCGRGKKLKGGGEK